MDGKNGKAKTKKRIKALNEPKAARTAYNFFVTQTVAQLKNDPTQWQGGVTELRGMHKEALRRWHVLSKVEQQLFVVLARKD
jgi:hypothetical protein